MTHTITLIPGDGIGPEVTRRSSACSSIRCVDQLGNASRRHQRLRAHGQTLPVELIDSIRKNKVALKGPVTTRLPAASRA